MDSSSQENPEMRDDSRDGEFFYLKVTPNQLKALDHALRSTKGDEMDYPQPAHDQVQKKITELWEYK